jgi:fructose-bisphosphate aldolase class 1
VTKEILQTLYSQLYSQRMALVGMIRKPNMVLPEKDCPGICGVGERFSIST